MIELWPRFRHNGKVCAGPKPKSRPSQWHLSGFLSDMKKGPKSGKYHRVARFAFHNNNSINNKIVLFLNVYIYVNYFRLIKFYFQADMRQTQIILHFGLKLITRVTSFAAPASTWQNMQFKIGLAFPHFRQAARGKKLIWNFAIASLTHKYKYPYPSIQIKNQFFFVESQ